MLRAARVRGIVGGAIILTLFGTAWCIIALVNWGARPAWAIPAASVAKSAEGPLDWASKAGDE